ncbi:Mediator complex, subunit Med6 [Sesbania bispinosa]|nr:Mediator complex, subunit Med6 [Sesbania bispinosa]
MLEGGAPQPPGTDMTGICFRDQLWLNTYPLDRNLVFDYFALSPFYDWTSNNEQLRMRSLHPLDLSQLSKMTGIEYVLSEVMEPHLFVIRKQKRDSPDKVTPMLAYYVLDGSIYQAPQLCNVFAARIGRALYYIQKAFTTAASKLEKIGYVILYPCRIKYMGFIAWQAIREMLLCHLIFHTHLISLSSCVLPASGSVDSENETALLESKVGKETIDVKEVKRVDHILASLQRKLPPAPHPPPFPEGYVPPSTAETEKGTETQEAAESQAPSVDPIIDQGPAKRMKF